MPNENGKYVSPEWFNGGPPAIDADEMNDLSDAIELVVCTELTVYMADTGTTVTATDGTATVTLTEDSGAWTGILPSYGTWTVSGTLDSTSVSVSVEVDAVKQYSVALVPSSLESTSWSVISTVSQLGLASNTWAVGDTKSVLIEGTVGTVEESQTLYVYIIGFDHDNTNGITFQGFKTAATYGESVCLVDGHYGSTDAAGSLWFNMNHWGNYNYGGWKGCDFRYDILGSTDIAPSGYGTTATTGRIGYDASSTTATSPVSGTLMAALPSDLRAVMQPMTLYTNNVGNSDTTQSAVTTSVDYLPLLAEFEIFGVLSSYGANSYEQDYQLQYEYYSAGNDKIKYQDSNTSTAARWFLRSPYRGSGTSFCIVALSGILTYYSSYTSNGVSPVFTV